MAWIRTVSPESDDSVRSAMRGQDALYPREYAEPVAELDSARPGITAVHSLIPEALRHAFSTFGALMSPDLPLNRREHELIALVVSSTNECRY